MSSIRKNVSSQKWVVFAWNDTTHVPVTGDAANITAKISIDGAAGSATADTNPTELEDGYYVFDLNTGETNGDLLLILPESSTANVQVEGCPKAVYTTEEINYSVRGIADSGSTTTMVDSARTEADTDYWKGSLIRFISGSIAGQTRLITGFTPGTDTITFAPATTQAVGTNEYEILPAGNVDLVNTVTTLTGHTAQTGDNYARLGAPAGASVSADIAAVQSDTDDIQTRIPATLVSGRIDANVGAISDDATAADNLEATYDGTGYIDGAAPATQDQVGSIGASSGASFSFEATADNASSPIKGVSSAGTETGTFANTEREDGSYHQITAATNDIDWIYQFNIGGGRLATQMVWKGYLDGSNDDAVIQAYDFVGADWETIATITGQASTTNVNIQAALLSKHTGTGADIGLVLIRIDGQNDDSSPILYTDLLNVDAVNIGQTVGYANGSIWVDTNNGTAGTEDFVNGTADNPVDSWADALTLSASLGVTKFAIVNGSSITLSANSDGYNLYGSSWSLDLGGQSIEGLSVHGANVSGTGTATTTMPHFYDCFFDGTTIGPSNVLNCVLRGTLTLGSVGDFFFINCRSGVAGASAPTINCNSLGSSSTLNIRSWSGGLNLTNVAATFVASIEIENGGTIDINGTGGSIFVRGRPTTVTDSSGGSVTVDTSGVVNMTSISAAVDANNVVLQETTIATLTTQTSFTLTDGSGDDDVYNNCVAVVEDATTPTQKAVVIVTDYVGSSKTVTLRAAPGFTIAPTDKITIFADIGNVEVISSAAQNDIQSALNSQGYSVTRALNLDNLDKSILTAEQEIILAMTQPDTLP